MSTYTIKDISDATGVSKATVKRRAIELGIYEAMQTVGNRNTKVMNEEQASMLTDAVQKLNPGGGETLTTEAIKDETITLLQSNIELLKDEVDNLRIRISQEQTDRAAERMGYQERIRQLEVDLRYAQACVQELAAAHWWEKKGIIARYALPPAPSGSQVD